MELLCFVMLLVGSVLIGFGVGKLTVNNKVLATFVFFIGLVLILFSKLM